MENYINLRTCWLPLWFICATDRGMECNWRRNHDITSITCCRLLKLVHFG